MLSSSAKAGRDHCLLAGCLVQSSCSENVTEQVANGSPDALGDAQRLMAVHPARQEELTPWALAAAFSPSVNLGDRL